MPILPLRAIAVALVSTMGVGVSQAQPDMGSEHLTIHARASANAIHAGSRGFIAIDIVCAEGWHTYWPGISDTGFGIEFTLNAPDTIELKDPIWPTPIRYLQEGDILDHTYEETVTVLYPFVVREDAAPTSVTVGVETSFLVCKDLCLPGSGSDSIAFDIVGDDEPEAASESAQRIEKLYKKRPQPFRATDPAVRLQWIDGAAAVMFRDATRIEFYPDDECTPIEDLIRDGEAKGNRMEIYFSEQENERLSGRIRIQTPQGELFYDIDEKAP